MRVVVVAALCASCSAVCAHDGARDAVNDRAPAASDNHPRADPTADIADGLGEASGVARAPAAFGGDFVVVDDDKGVVVVKDGSASVVAAAKDLEGVCVIGDVVVVVSEASGVVSVVSADGTMTPKGTLPPPTSTQHPKKNKGWEGIAFLRASLAVDGKDHLVAVHEGAPRVVSLFSWPALTLEVQLALPPSIDGLVADLSDVAVDPKSGGLLLLSDKSRRLLRVALSGVGSSTTLKLTSTTELAVQKHEKPEGVFVDDDGRVYVVTDGSGRLFVVP